MKISERKDHTLWLKKTTLKELITIIQDALAHGKNYQKTAEDYQVSYQQVYQRVPKCETDG